MTGRGADAPGSQSHRPAPTPGGAASAGNLPARVDRGAVASVAIDARHVGDALDVRPVAASCEHRPGRSSPRVIEIVLGARRRSSVPVLRHPRAIASLRGRAARRRRADRSTPAPRPRTARDHSALRRRPRPRSRVDRRVRRVLPRRERRRASAPVLFNWRFIWSSRTALHSRLLVERQAVPRRRGRSCSCGRCVVAVVRQLPGRAFLPLRTLAIVYADVFRGIPAIIVIYLIGSASRWPASSRSPPT